jgi:hypothetical protein
MKKKLLPLLVLIAASTLIHSCKKESEPAPVPEPAPPTGGAPTITSSFYFQAKIDGAWVTYQDGVGQFASGMSSTNYGSTTNQEEQGALLINYSTFRGGSIFMLKTLEMPSASDYEGMFAVQSYNYGINADTPGHPTGIDGAGVGFIDPDGVMWRTDEGTGDQTGSTFKITEYITNPDASSPKICKAVFSCKLYDGNGNIKTLTDGILRGRVLHY